MLIAEKDIDIRFSEVDSLAVVWHGHHVKFFEDGREAFGRQFGLGYMDVYREGFFLPVVDLKCSYKKVILYEDPVVIHTTFIDSRAAKLIFEYKLYHKETKEVYATGSSIQVFLNENRELQLTIPDFFAAWKEKWISNPEVIK